jgi:hypothetical protein
MSIVRWGELMGKRFVAAAGVLLAVTAIGAPSASAATEFGDNCEVGDSAGAPVTLFGITAPANPLPLAAPSSGVITSWKMNLPSVPFQIPQALKIIRLDSGSKTLQVVGEDTRVVGAGASSFDVKIPVQAGDRIGLYGGGAPFGTLLCESPEPTTLGGYEGGSPVGSTVSYEEISVPNRVPVSALIEPDADADGFGDETQDQCPQSATTAAACPVIVLDAFAIAGKGSATVLVSSSTEAPISVVGTVALPKTKRKAGSSARAKIRKVTKNVKPGSIAKFKLTFPGKLESAIAALAPGKSLTLKITASAKNISGTVAKDKVRLKLK